MTGAPAPDAELISSVAQAVPGNMRHVAVAVSGGGDSVALLHLLVRASAQSGFQVSAVTVDHRLRPEAAEEAAFVARLCARLGVGHDTLVWDHGALSGNMLANARAARHALIGDWARARGIPCVALGHTADDQAEGFLMALTRQAGLDGLSGMEALRIRDGLCWVRPLLGQSRAGLRAYLLRQGAAWIEDPTNADPRYLRVQARAALQALQAMGLQATDIARSVSYLSQARGALDHAVLAFADRHVTEVAGTLEVDLAAFVALHSESQRRLLAAAVRWIGGAPYPARRVGLGQALLAVLDRRGATLGGVRFRSGPRRLRIAREPKAVGSPVAVGQVWDGRWIVTGAQGGEVRAVGVAGLAQIPGWRSCGVARDALVVSPGIWDGARLIAAPCAGFGQDWTAETRPDFASFLLSH